MTDMNDAGEQEKTKDPVNLLSCERLFQGQKKAAFCAKMESRAQKDKAKTQNARV
jgi:hypothetical protein